ncbi:MAG: hypothetical protein AAF513_13320 [Pseudomonadota bacterium]
MIIRHPRRATELAAGGALVLAVALVLAACSVTSSEPGVAGPNSLPPAAASSALPPPTTPSSTAVAASPIVIERLWSPENAVAEMNGSGASPGAVVTVDDETQTDASFDFGTDGAFTMRVQILDEGAHTVCVDDACGRVYTRAIDAESIEEVEAKIDEAIVLARQRFDFEAALPEWRIEVAGPMSGTGGSTDAENKTIVIHSNRDRSLDEYVVTVLHEWGHAVDAEIEAIALQAYPTILQDYERGVALLRHVPIKVDIEGQWLTFFQRSHRTGGSTPRLGEHG